ncbi:MAG: hypothetical protein IIB45_06525 [Candidatus Marinimicrobia bacterium]|nr:hypothetical protein [Candidatus Neomarinimicrobiota bacterium]
MTLLDDIQNEAIDASNDLGTLLRKCKVLAARLGSQPLEDWLLWESNGYPDGVEVPNYRIWPLELKGHFFGSFGAEMSDVPIPLAVLSDKVRESYQNWECRQSIASIEALVSLLTRKGLITQQEILDELKAIKLRDEKKKN